MREEESGVLRRLKSASGHQNPCTVKRLLYVGCAATEETTAASAAELKRSRSRDSALQGYFMNISFPFRYDRIVFCLDRIS